MTPSGVHEILSRIAVVSRPPAAVARFATALDQRAAAATTPAATTVAEPVAATEPTDASPVAVAARRSVTASISTTVTTRRDTSLPASAAPWVDLIRGAATRHGIDPDMLTALVWVESSFQPDAVSPAGAIGLAQLMPGTARSLRVDPTDPAQNLEGSARMLAGLIEEFGRVDHALAAYNVGPNGLKRGLAEGRTPGAGYAEAVATKYRTITGRELF